MCVDFVGKSGECLKDFVWVKLKAEGQTCLGAALRELNKSLTRNDKMEAVTGNKAPIVIIMTDGYPNDDWEDALNEIAKNRWYQQAIKIGFAVGDHADGKIIAKVVGVKSDGSIVPDPEAVIKTNDLETFANMIRVASVTSSLKAGGSINEQKPVTGATVVTDIAGQNAAITQGGVIPQIDKDIYSNTTPTSSADVNWGKIE